MRLAEHFSKLRTKMMVVCLFLFLPIFLAVRNPEKLVFVCIIPVLIIFLLKPIIPLAAFVFLMPFETSLVGVDDFFSFMKISGVIVSIVYFLNKTVKKGLPRIKDIPHAKLLLLFLGLMFISAVFSIDRELSLAQYLTYLQLFVLYVIIVDFVDNEPKLQYLITFLLIGGTISGIYSIYNFYFARGALFGFSISREGGFLQNANRFGYVQTLIFLFTFPYAINMRRRFYRVVSILLAAVILFSSFLSLSRGVSLALVVTGGYAVIKLFRQRKISGGLLITLIIISVLLPVAYWERLDTIIYPDGLEGSRYVRLAFLQDGLRMGVNHPLMGVGLGRFNEEFLNVSNKAVFTLAGGAHNMYVSILAENGIPAFVVFLLLVYNSLRKPMLYKNRTNTKLAYYSYGIELGMVFSLGIGCFATIEYSKMFWLLLAMCAVPERIVRQRQKCGNVVIKT